MTATSQSYELRPYQDNLIAEVRLSWATYRRLLLQLPTGGGNARYC